MAVIKNLDEPFRLAPYVEYIEDTERSLTYEQIQSPAFDNRWLTNSNPTFIAKNQKSRYWFRITLHPNPEIAAFNPVLYIPHQAALLYELTLYMPNNDGGHRVITTGFAHPYYDKDIPSLRYAFQLPTALTSYTVVGWVDHRYAACPAILPLFFISSEQFRAAEQQAIGIMIAFYAIMASLLLYNGCLFATLRQPLYGFYLLFLSSTILTCAFVDGSTYRWLWPESSALNYRLVNTNAVLQVFFYLAFVWEALRHLNFSVSLRKCFLFMFWFGGFSLLHNLLTPYKSHAGFISQFYPALVMPLSLIAIVTAMRRHLPTSGYLLVAEAFMIGGGTGFLLTIQGILPVNAITQWELHGCYLGEAILLSLALAARTTQAQRDAIQHLHNYQTLYEQSVEGSFREINERRLKEHAEQERKAMQLASEAKSQFFASISHELRTPLTAMLGYAESSIGTAVSETQKDDNLKIIQQSGKHLLHIVNDILDLSKIEAQKLDVENIPCNLLAILNEVENYFLILSKTKNIEFSFDYQFPLPATIISDPTRLKQILINLCGNAVKFTAKGSVVVAVSCDKNQEHMAFAVRDTGIGLKPNQLAQLFGAYDQLDSSVHRQFGGTGLGLYLSKQIAEKLGGDIVVESEFRKGSVFTLQINTGSLSEVTWVDQLPQHDTQSDILTAQQIIGLAPTTEDENSPLKQSTNNYKILLAEDNPVNQQLISFHLRRAGAEVIIANDGVEAILEALRQKIDLILMDMEMPALDGLTAVSALRAKGCETLIYALTSNNSEAAIKQCLDAGCDGHLAKPLELAKLNAVIQRINPNNIYPPTLVN